MFRTRFYKIDLNSKNTFLLVYLWDVIPWGIFPFLFLAIYILSWFVLRDGTFQRKDFSLFYQHLGKYPHCRLLCCISMPLSVSLFLSLSPSDNTTHTRSLDIDASFSLASYFFVVNILRVEIIFSVLCGTLSVLLSKCLFVFFREFERFSIFCGTIDYACRLTLSVHVDSHIEIHVYTPHFSSRHHTHKYRYDGIVFTRYLVSQFQSAVSEAAASHEYNRASASFASPCNAPDTASADNASTGNPFSAETVPVYVLVAPD